MAEMQTFAYGEMPSLSRGLSCKNDTLPHDRLALKLEVKAGSEPGTFEGYGAIFGNRDNDNDIVVKGAFVDSLQARTPAMLWQHNTKEPIGRFFDVREDEKGLYVRGKLSMKGKGAEAYELLSMGAMDGLSIGFVTKEATRDAATGTRTIHKADLMEISLVTFPANEMARIDSVKAADTITDERAFERFLRASGFSRNRAKTITAKGFKVDITTNTKGNNMGSQAQEIADLVTGLEIKRDLLTDFSETKKGKTKPKKTSRAKELAIEHGVKLLKKAYVTLRPSPQPIRMLRGESSQFRLAINFDTRGKVRVVPQGMGIQMFECEVIYWKWTSKGPKRSKLKLFQRKGAARLNETYYAGSYKELREWLSSFSTVEQVESAIARMGQVINSLAPHGTITYKGPHLKDPIPDMEHSEVAFRIVNN